MKPGYIPLDPTCVAVMRFYEHLTDPYNDSLPGYLLAEIVRDFADEHRDICSRCQQYGADHIEVGA